MVLPKSLTTVTTFSKILAMILFILLPFVGFYVGYKYNGLTYSNTPVVQNSPISAPSITSAPNPTADPTANWKTYTSVDGSYSFKYPATWSASNKDPNNLKVKGFVSFQNYEIPNTREMPMGNPKDHVYGSVSIAGGNSFRGEAYKNLSASDFFNPKSSFWIVGSRLGGGPGTDFGVPQEKTVGGKRAMAQISHPSQDYEAVSPNDISINYYVYLNQNEILFIGFNYRSDYESKNQVLQQYDQILSTFKFTN